MSEANTIGAASLRPSTAGGLLREARLAQGVHIAALAAAIKVVPRKLELLESDQFEQLPDATFTRALAQAVCRSLKIDSAPILALMPPPNGHRLEQVAEGLNTPFHERPGRLVAPEWATVTGPVLWIAGLLLVAAAVVYVVPSEWLQRRSESSPLAAPSLPSPGAASAAPVTVEPPAPAIAAAPVEATASAATDAGAAPAAAPSADASPAAPAPAILQLHAKAASWIRVVDAGGQVLLARLVQPDESVTLDGAMPMKLTIGNAVATEVTLRGQPVELATHTSDNVARLEVQ